MDMACTWQPILRVIIGIARNSPGNPGRLDWLLSKRVPQLQASCDFEKRTGQLESQRAGFQAPATQRQQQAHEEHAGNSNGIAVLEGPRDREATKDPPKQQPQNQCRQATRATANRKVAESPGPRPKPDFN